MSEPFLAARSLAGAEEIRRRLVAPLSMGEFRHLHAVCPGDAAVEYLRRAGPVATRIARRLRLSADSADDLVQESYAQAVSRNPTSLRRARSETRFAAWVSGVIWNLAAGRSESDSHEKEALSRLAPSAREFASDPRNIAGDLAALRGLIRTANLTVQQRCVLALVAHGASVRATAVLCGVDRHTVDQHLRRGLLRLRAQVRTEFRDSCLQSGGLDPLHR